MEIFIRLWYRIKKFLKESLEILGAYSIIREVIEMSETSWGTDNKKGIYIVLSFFIITIFIKNIFKFTYKFSIKNKDINVKIKIGNIIRQKSALIIPTNTTFDTKMENDFISIKSVQGQVQNKYFKKKIVLLDNLIDSSLSNQSYIALNDRTDSKTKRYEIGTVAKINYKKKRFYFLANSNVNPSGQTEQPSMEDIKISLEKLWKYIKENGHVESIAIPLLGTGRMGLTNVREEVIKEIIKSFIKGNKNKKIATELIIYVRAEDIREFNIDMIKLEKRISYICDFWEEELE